MARLTALITLLVCFSACGGPTAPSSTFTLSGTVFTGGTALVGASVTIMDGVNAGLSRDTDHKGSYTFLVLTPSAFTLQARSGRLTQNKAVNLTANQSVHFQLIDYCDIDLTLC